MRRAVFASALALAIATGCGGERTLDAQEFVEAANNAGAGILLGPALNSVRDDIELYELRFPGNSATGGGRGVEDEHGGGSIAVAADADAATAEFARCEEAVTLICYRAANVAVLLEGVDISEQARIDAAIRKLASE